jgi:AmmeMemoRadiSam system protein B
MTTTRPAAVAGLFYPDNPIELKRTVADLLAHAKAGDSLQAPKALIVPHAGYI